MEVTAIITSVLGLKHIKTYQKFFFVCLWGVIDNGYLLLFLGVGSVIRIALQNENQYEFIINKSLSFRGE